MKFLGTCHTYILNCSIYKVVCLEAIVTVCDIVVPLKVWLCCLQLLALFVSFACNTRQTGQAANNLNLVELNAI